MDFFQNGKSLGAQLSSDDLIAMQDSQTGDRGYAKLSDVITGGAITLTSAQRASVRAGLVEVGEELSVLTPAENLSPGGRDVLTQQ